MSEEKDPHEYAEEANEAHEHAHGEAGKGKGSRIFALLVISTLALGVMFTGKSAEHAEHGSTYNLIQSQDKWTEFGTNSVKAHQIESANQTLSAIDKLGSSLDKLGGLVDKLTNAQAASTTDPAQKQALAEAQKELSEFHTATKGLHDQVQGTIDKNIVGVSKYEKGKTTAHDEATHFASVSSEETGVAQRFVTVGSIFALAITLGTLAMAVGEGFRKLLLVGSVLLGLFGATLGYGPRYGVDIAPLVGYDFSGTEQPEAGEAAAPADKAAIKGEHAKTQEEGKHIAPEKLHE